MVLLKKNKNVRLKRMTVSRYGNHISLKRIRSFNYRVTKRDLEMTKKKMDIRKRLAKQLGIKAEILTGTRRDQKVDCKMDKVLEKFKIQYATENKTFMGIKLTDSFLNSCMNFQKLKKHFIEDCKIKFNGDDGEISVPSSSGDRQFKFRSNRFNQEFDECMLQKKDTIFVTGMISKRLNIQGNEDAYKATKEKMTLVEQESKKNCTKVLESNFSRFDKNQNRPKSLPQVQAPQANGKPRPNLLSRLKPQVDPAEAASKRNSTCPRPLLAGTRNSKPVTSPVEAKEVSVPTEAKEVPFPAEAKEEPPVNFDFSAIMNYTYRERIVHLLAIRPYKKIELQHVLDRHGPSDRDRLPWIAVLGSVAIFNRHESSYSLKPTSYDEVKEDWPFYDEETREVIKKKLEELRHRSISPCSTSSSSSHSSHASSSSASQAQKRLTSEEYCVAPKKQRIAHPQKPSTQDTVALSSPRTMTPMANVSPPQPPVAVPVSQPVPVDASQAPVVTSIAVEYPLDGFVNNEELENLASAYGPIIDKDQRELYRAEFEAGSREYNWMYGLINAYIKVFSKLERKLKAASPSEIEAVQDEIYISYLKLKNDREYMSQRSALDRLKKKLNHIRCMIEHYDDRVLESS